MYNSSTAFSSSNTQYKNRLFVYEVEGLSRKGVDTQVPIRNSGTVLVLNPQVAICQRKPLSLHLKSKLHPTIVNI